jgi:hypothetical protein
MTDQRVEGVSCRRVHVCVQHRMVSAGNAALIPTDTILPIAAEDGDGIPRHRPSRHSLNAFCG